MPSGNETALRLLNPKYGTVDHTHSLRKFSKSCLDLYSNYQRSKAIYIGRHEIPKNVSRWWLRFVIQAVGECQAHICKTVLAAAKEIRADKLVGSGRE